MSKLTPLARSAVALWSGWIVVAVLLWSRRLAGEIHVTSPIPSMVLSFLSSTMSVVAWWLFRQSALGEQSATTQWGGAVAAWVSACGAAAAVAPVNSSLAWGWLLGLASLLGVALSCGVTRRQEHLNVNTVINDQSHSTPVPVEEPPLQREPALEMSYADPELAVFSPAGASLANGTTTQWMTRQTQADGADCMEGSIRVSFEPGQRLVSVHVPFTPPFVRTPMVECETDGDVASRWKISVVYPYGMRVELKRDASTEPGTVELAYSAICEQLDADAA